MQAAQRWARASPTESPLACISRKWKVRHNSSIPKTIPNRRTKHHREHGVDSTLREKRGPGGRERRLSKNKHHLFESPSPETKSTLDDREVIIPHSLEETLRAHQKANRDSVIIRRVTQNQQPRNIDYQRKRWSETPENIIETDGLHLDLEREDIQEGQGEWTDYKSTVRPLSHDWQIIGGLPPSLTSPWIIGLNQRQNSREWAATRLNEEIRAADVYFSPDEAEWAATNQIIKQLERLVLRSDKSLLKLDVIGSRASGLATPLSDLDLNLVTTGTVEGLARNDQLTVLSRLYRTLRFGKLDGIETHFTMSYFVPRARIPIIVGRHASGLEFQIQSANSCYGSLELVKSLCAEYPTLRPLFKIIKQSLKMRGLADGRQGGLTSYPLINMLVVTLKKHARRTDPFDASQHLLQFLEYWSTIDLYKTGITHIPSTYLVPTDGQERTHFANSKSAANTIDLVTQDPVGARPIEFDVRKNLSEIHEGQNNFMLTLHDPANPYNDLGRSAYAIKHIQATFTDMHVKLKKAISAWDAQIRAEGEAGRQPPSLLNPLIEGDYSLYNMERKRLSVPPDFASPD